MYQAQRDGLVKLLTWSRKMKGPGAVKQRGARGFAYSE
jgi:hypothetical protein